MKAVRIHEYGGPEVLVYEEVPTPEPGPAQILVKVAAATVNPVDVSVREDRFPTPKKPPKTLGSDGAGVVERVGGEITSVKPGDRVAFSGLGIGSEGSYAEYALIAETQVVPMPDGLSFVDAAAIGMAFPAAYYALVTRGALREGETVLVQGASGGVGSASVQLARALGARVLATASGPGAADLVLGLGAEAVIDFRTEDVAARVLELTDGKGVDLVHELVLSVNLPADVKLVAKGGRIVGTGQGPGPDATAPIGEALVQGRVRAVHEPEQRGRAGVAAIAAEIAPMAAAGKVKPVIGAELPLSEARRAHELLAGGPPRQDRAAAVDAGPRRGETRGLSTPCRCRGWPLRAPCAARAAAAASSITVSSVSRRCSSLSDSSSSCLSAAPKSTAAAMRNESGPSPGGSSGISTSMSASILPNTSRTASRSAGDPSGSESR